MTDATLPLASSVALLFPELERELAKTRRLLERFPDDQAGWQPHPKSRSLASLASHIASLGIGAELLQTDEIDVSARPVLVVHDTAGQLLTLFDERAGALRAALRETTAERLDQTWTLRIGPQVLLAQPRRVTFREMVINHFIHHRAQLGVYYRLLDVAVPATYGPSADEPMAV